MFRQVYTLGDGPNQMEFRSKPLSEAYKVLLSYRFTTEEFRIMIRTQRSSEVMVVRGGIIMVYLLPLNP